MSSPPHAAELRERAAPHDAWVLTALALALGVTGLAFDTPNVRWTGVSIAVVAVFVGMPWAALAALVVYRQRAAGVLHLLYGLLIVALGVAGFAWPLLVIGKAVVLYGAIESLGLPR